MPTQDSPLIRKARRRIKRQIKTGVAVHRVRFTEPDVYEYWVRHDVEKLVFKLKGDRLYAVKNPI